MLKKAAVILARGGSKGIPRKNVVRIKGKPLVQYAIDAAHASVLDRVYVSTDDDEIERVSAGLGAEVIRRPPDLAGDLSLDIDGMRHVVYTNEHLRSCDYIVQLRATFPDVTAEIINAAIRQFEDSYDEYDSLRSVIKAPCTPYKMWHIDFDAKLVPVVPGNVMHSTPRQLIPVAYWQNACVDIIKITTILDLGSMVGNACMPFIMSGDYDGDIDSFDDYERVIASKK